MAVSGIVAKKIIKFAKGKSELLEDSLAVEEPLEISLQDGKGTLHKISVTMRTPGSDLELAAGFLFTEGIIHDAADIESIGHTQTLPGMESNTLTVNLKPNVVLQKEKINRNFYTTSSCGVCGKASIDAIKTVGIYQDQKSEFQIDSELLQELPKRLRQAQETFDKTGGLHASALFDLHGNLLYIKEDVGRHNALDKLIGRALLDGQMPLKEHVLLLSGRASFELLQKAAMAGIPMVCAVGAPSSLAVETAQDFGITLVGFLNSERFNIYSGEERVH